MNPFGMFGSEMIQQPGVMYDASGMPLDTSMGYPGGGMAMPMGGYPVGGMPMMGQQYPSMGYQSPIGRMDYSGYVKYSRAQMLEGLRNYVVMANQGRVPISREEKLDETPQYLRHACAECGVSQLQMLQFNIPEAGVSIPFYFCTACGKLFYWKDFYM